MGTPVIARWLCVLFRGHEWIRSYSAVRVRLECLHCGATTHGWTFADEPPRRPRTWRFWRRTHV